MRYKYFNRFSQHKRSVMAEWVECTAFTWATELYVLFSPSPVTILTFQLLMMVWVHDVKHMTFSGRTPSRPSSPMCVDYINETPETRVFIQHVITCSLSFYLVPPWFLAKKKKKDPPTPWMLALAGQWQLTGKRSYGLIGDRKPFHLFFSVLFAFCLCMFMKFSHTPSG